MTSCCHPNLDAQHAQAQAGADDSIQSCILLLSLAGLELPGFRSGAVQTHDTHTNADHVSLSLCGSLQALLCDP